MAATTRTSTLIVAVAAHAGELASCRTRRSLACSGERHLADLVEEDGAAVGELELAGLALRRRR